MPVKLNLFRVPIAIGSPSLEGSLRVRFDGLVSKLFNKGFPAHFFFHMDSLLSSRRGGTILIVGANADNVNMESIEATVTLGDPPGKWLAH